MAQGEVGWLDYPSGPRSPLHFPLPSRLYLDNVLDPYPIYNDSRVPEGVGMAH